MFRIQHMTLLRSLICFCHLSAMNILAPTELKTIYAFLS